MGEVEQLLLWLLEPVGSLSGGKPSLVALKVRPWPALVWGSLGVDLVSLRQVDFLRRRSLGCG